MLCRDVCRWDPDLLRMVYDEPVRYRLTQLIGNLSLLNIAGCQGIPVGHVTAHNATPALQVGRMGRALGFGKSASAAEGYPV